MFEKRRSGGGRRAEHRRGDTTERTAVNRPVSGGRRGLALVAAGIVLVVALGLTSLLASSVRRTAHDDAQAQFQQAAQQTRVGVQEEIRKYFTAITDVGALVESVPAVTPEQFRSYVESARVFERLPSLAGMFYVRRVPESDFDAFAKQARQANPDFSPFPITNDPLVPGAPRYILLQYVAGPANADLQLPVGAEFSPLKAITDILIVSGQTGQGVVGSFQHDPVLQRIAEQAKIVPLQRLLDLDFFIGLPVYATSRPGAPKGDLIGWTAAPVSRFQEVVAGAAKGTPQGLGMSLTVDLTDTNLRERQDLSRVAQEEGTAGPQDRSAFRSDEPFNIEGVTFHLSVWSTPDADDAPNTVAIVLLGGLVGSLLAAGVMYLRFRAHDRERAFALELADRALFQREIVDSVTNAMVVLDANGDIVASNPAWSELLGVEPDQDEALAGTGQSYLDVMENRVRGPSESLASGIASVLSGERGAVEMDVPLEYGRMRSWFAVRATPLRGVHGGAVVVHSDITERKRSHDELEFKASRDNLTGLLNRAALETDIDDALRHARAVGSSVAVLFIDLDGFKQINDAYGHAVGDDVLRTVSTRVSTAVRTTDRVGRLGGDEFVVLIAPLASPSVATTTAERILRSLDEPVAVGGQLLSLAASVGVAVVDSPLDVSGADLIERADEAMYRAKEHGGSSFEVAP